MVLFIYGGSKANKSNSQAASGDHQIVPAQNRTGLLNPYLGGGLFSPLFGEDFQFD